MRFLAFIYVFIIFSLNGFGQSKVLKKANRFFKEEKYALAIPHYQKALTTKKNLSIKSKLAYCYKITNQIPKALELYEAIVANERAKTKSYLYYAETLMSSGRYEEAKVWFEKYGAIETEDDRVARMIASCDFAKTVSPYFGHAVITSFAQNSDADDTAPIFWDNGIVFTSDRKGKLKFLDTKSGATDRNYLRLYHSQQLEDGSYDKPKEYISKINDARKNTGMATFQANGKVLFFTRNGSYLNKQNAYCLQLFEAKSEDGKSWEKAQLVNFCRKAANYMHPAVSPDGKFLFFVSDKAGGMGGTDIYVSKKEKNRWGKPENLGVTINTDAHEGFPFMHANGKLYFCSKGHLGLGGFDVFVTELDGNGAWKKPTNLGAPINSPADDISIFINEEENKGVFTSSREGGDDDIFLLALLPEPVAIEDEATTILSDWNTDTTLATSTEKVPEFEEILPKPITEKIAKPTDFLAFYNTENTAFSLAVTYSLPTIQFGESSYFITFEMAEELDKLAEILKIHPTLQIEIAAHTANLSTFKEKIDLTAKRAAAIKDYLIRKGIEETRLAAIGYGGQKPLNNCLMDIDCSPEEHQLNDRLEVKILSL